MSFFDRFKTNAESVLYKKAAGDPSQETDTEEKFLKNINMNRTEFPEDIENLMSLKSLILKDLKVYQSVRHSDKDGSNVRDAYVKVYVAENKMTAFLCVFPPVYGGADITAESILEDLSLEGIEFGIDQELIGTIAANKQYLCMYAAARGTHAKDGKDGQIIDLLEKNEKMNIQVGADRTIDFEKPILFHRIKKGEAICTIVPPEPGGDGYNIFGRVHTGRNGAPVTVSQGNHTVLSKDKTVLLAEIDGDISFDNGVYSIENRLVIEGDLTDPSEKLEFGGDIVISGDVGNHVKIHAGGGIIIGGQVGAAIICAGTYIYIPKGMSGTTQGNLEARGDVLCKSLENVKVVVKGDLYANVVNKCDITADGSVYIKGGKGILIGGTIRTAGSLEAKRIGNQSLCVNAISIGYNPQLNAYMKKVQEKIGEIENTLNKITKARQQLSGNPSLSQERKDLLQQMNQQEKLYQGEKSKLELERNQYLDERRNEEKTFVKAENIAPLTIITFRSKRLTLSKECNNCKILYTGSELRQI